MNVKVNPMSRREPQSGSWDSCSCVYKKRRSKTDWAGLGIGDAFKPGLDYFLRISAQRLFYAACRKVQMAAARMGGFAGESGYQPKSKPQLGPCYTAYPGTLAAYSAIGLTGFLEFEAVASGGCLAAHLEEYLKNPAAHDEVSADPAFYQRIARLVTHTVQSRLLLEDLSRSAGMSLVELYRLFSASQQSLTFDSVPEIVNAVILYGDILPDWESLTLHPVTRVVFRDLDAVCGPYFTRLAEYTPQDLASAGVSWVRDVCRCLSKYVPPPQQEVSKAAGPEKADDAGNAEDTRHGFKQPKEPAASDKISPLNGPNPPALFSPPTAAERAVAALLANMPPPAGTGEHSPAAAQAAQALQNFAKAVDQAGGQKAQWEDMRSDLVERAMTAGTFSESPIQGNPTDGHEVKMRLGKNNVAAGEIYDRSLELSDNFPACDALIGESQPIADALRRALYPNVEERVETEWLRSTGALDPARLAMADYSSVVFRRYRIYDKADRKGQPLLLIACDGSGSLSYPQMRMLKVLAAAWLSSTARTHVQVMAGLYHSGEVRQGVSGPLVQWIYHPQKTPAISRKDALRALVSLPDTGTGAQSDALSLMFMLNEAVRVARGRMIYLILLSDCQWNRSFSSEKSGQEEVRALFETVYEDIPDKFHVTLVALGHKGQTEFEDLLDKVITVPESRLADVAGLAEQIGVYVASCMKERRKVMSRN
ncbi:MAG: hypothetical protein WCK89_06835 [bacterium]